MHANIRTSFEMLVNIMTISNHNHFLIIRYGYLTRHSIEYIYLTFSVVVWLKCTYTRFYEPPTNDKRGPGWDWNPNVVLFEAHAHRYPCIDREHIPLCITDRVETKELVRNVEYLRELAFLATFKDSESNIYSQIGRIISMLNQ